MNYYLGVASTLGSWVLYSNTNVYSTSSASAGIGPYFNMYVQLVAAGVQPLTCSPASTVGSTPVVQLSYCLVTAPTSSPTLSGSVVYSYASGLDERPSRWAAARIW